MTDREHRQKLDSLVQKLQEPNLENVELGDLVVIPYSQTNCYIKPVFSKNEKTVSTLPPFDYSSDKSKHIHEYNSVIILKKDGRYLVGEHVRDNLRRHLYDLNELRNSKVKDLEIEERELKTKRKRVDSLDAVL